MKETGQTTGKREIPEKCRNGRQENIKKKLTIKDKKYIKDKKQKKKTIQEYEEKGKSTWNWKVIAKKKFNIWFEDNIKNVTYK